MCLYTRSLNLPFEKAEKELISSGADIIVFSEYLESIVLFNWETVWRYDRGSLERKLREVSANDIVILKKVRLLSENNNMWIKNKAELLWPLTFGKWIEIPIENSSFVWWKIETERKN